MGVSARVESAWPWRSSPRRGSMRRRAGFMRRAFASAGVRRASAHLPDRWRARHRGRDRTDSLARPGTFSELRRRDGYLYQADTLLAGRLSNAPHQLQPFFVTSHILERGGRLFGVFPPGSAAHRGRGHPGWTTRVAAQSAAVRWYVRRDLLAREARHGRRGDGGAGVHLLAGTQLLSRDGRVVLSRTPPPRSSSWAR